MFTVQTRNVHQALPEAARLFRHNSTERNSRNGRLKQLDQPLSTCFMRPSERVIFWKARNANPFFHLMESLWMLAGRSDVLFVAKFNKRMFEFSDDGKHLNGAYGYRWRSYFGRDQLRDIISALRNNRECRRQVLTMWDARKDLGSDSRDVPCNTQAYLQVNARGALDMMVVNRSNDLIWGAYGANAVHFSVMQEYVAAHVGASVGTYHQVSMNTHVYERHWELLELMSEMAVDPPSLPSCPYSNGHVVADSMVKDPVAWDRDLHIFCSTMSLTYGYKEPFFAHTVVPMLRAYNFIKGSDANREGLAMNALHDVASSDWRTAAQGWIESRVHVNLS